MDEFKVRSVAINKEFDLFYLLFCSLSDLVQSKCIKKKKIVCGKKRHNEIVRIEILHKFASQYLKKATQKNCI